VGIVARIDQQEMCFRAHRGVILAAGGFIMNERLAGLSAASRLSE
jgi:hypothetical protein